MSRLSVAGLAAFLAFAPAAFSQSESQPRSQSHSPQTQPAPSPPAPLITLRGTPQEIGQQHGKQLHSQIQLLHQKYLNVYIGTGAHRLLAIGAAKVFKTFFPPEDLAEVDSLAATQGMDESEAVLAQCFLDLSPMTACSTMTLPASASPDHIARFARNLDFPALNIADKYSTVF